MKALRVSTAALCYASAVLAFDFAWLRYILTADHSVFRFTWPSGGDTELELVLVGMSTVLALCFPAYRRARRPFLSGFLISGLSAALTYLALCRVASGALSDCMGAVADYYEAFLPPGVYNPDTGRPFPPAVLGPLVALLVVVFMLPQLAVALAGGFLARYVASRRARG